jgi:hypothetical protein
MKTKQSRKNKSDEIFGIPKTEYVSVAKQTVSARATADPLHPVGAAGTFMYHEGVLALRRLLITKGGWRPSTVSGVEATVNDNLGVQLWYQTVDQACDATPPQPLREKGSGAKSLLATANRDLFPRSKSHPQPKGSPLDIWWFCLSFKNDRLSAELSKPHLAETDSSMMYEHRIFLIDETHKVDPEIDLTDTYEPEFTIQRK